MAFEKLHLRNGGDQPDRVVSVEYVRATHWDGESPAYDVLIDGKKIAKIERATENTDRHYGRIRSPGKGRPAWSWTQANPGDGAHLDGRRSNSPGVYEPTRAAAVARALGYWIGTKVAT